jgi:CRP-like cAMP-binding protein
METRSAAQVSEIAVEPKTFAHAPSKTMPGPSIFVRRLEAVNNLSDTEKALIGRLSVFRESIQAGRPFWRQGQPVAARVIISGWACRQRTLPDGRRQIFGLLLPGDTVGLNVVTAPLDQMSTVAINRVESMDALMLREILTLGDGRYGRLKAAVNETRRLEDVYLLNHVMRLGRQSALERLAHLILEIQERCRLAGLLRGGRFPMPLTQEVLSDALGLSIVHVNRTLQQLKREGLIEAKGGQATILDQRRLENIADYGSHDE